MTKEQLNKVLVDDMVDYHTWLKEMTPEQWKSYVDDPIKYTKEYNDARTAK